MKKVCINGKFVERERAKISVFDRGFLYGDGVFETMRAYSGVIFGLSEHLRRLSRALRLTKIRISYQESDLGKMLKKTLRLNGLSDASVRLSVSRGGVYPGFCLNKHAKPTVVMSASALPEYPRQKRERGISIKVSPIRQNEFSPATGIKSLNFLNNILARIDADALGFDDALFMNTTGSVSEGTTGNVFIVRKNTLITPSLAGGTLPGITRGFILKLAGGLRIPCEERRVRCKELMCADEVFLTNSLYEIMPVIKIDKKLIGSGSAGRITEVLRGAYKKLVRRKIEKHLPT